jgi:hypothetical protein
MAFFSRTYGANAEFLNYDVKKNIMNVKTEMEETERDQ